MINFNEFYEKYIAPYLKPNFKETLESYREEEPEEYKEYIGNSEEIELRYYGMQYEVRFPKLNDPKITIIVDMYRGHKNIGYYKEYYLLNGEFFDSDFVLE